VAEDTPTPQIGKGKELKNIGYELFIGGLSILSILNLVLLWLFVKNEDIQMVLYIMNAIMTPIFLGDFFYRFFTAESRNSYFFRGFGWADLISSLPLPQFKILRVFRLWRVIRLFRKFGARNLVNEFIYHRADNALLTVAFLVLCVLEFGSLAVLKAESSSPDANITNAADAIWWCYVTITTVGYGDKYPTTNWGRFVGILVMSVGVGLFGTLAAYLSQIFLAPGKKKEKVEEDQVAPEDPKQRLAEILQQLEAQEKAAAELRGKLEEVTKLL
jgi:voltage-gated potassium channel Kch